jgi:hypothetical protein
MELDPNARAGLEQDLRNPSAPYVVKSPWFVDYAHEVLGRDDLVVDHVFVPMRDLAAAAESRRFVVQQAKRKGTPGRPSQIAGGLWHTDDMHEQELILMAQIYKLNLVLASSSVPVTLLQYPRLARDPEYLFDKLQPVLKDVPFERFDEAFEGTVRPELVHTFTDQDH